MAEFKPGAGMTKNGQKRYATEVIAEEVDFAESKRENNSVFGSAFGIASNFDATNDDELPF